MTDTEFEAGAREARLKAVEKSLREHEERNERRFDKLAEEITNLKTVSYVLVVAVAISNGPEILQAINVLK